MATVEQLAIIKSNPDMSVRALAERTGLSKSRVNELQRSVASIDIGTSQVVITKRSVA